MCLCCSTSSLVLKYVHLKVSNNKQHSAFSICLTLIPFDYFRSILSMPFFELISNYLCAHLLRYFVCIFTYLLSLSTYRYAPIYLRLPVYFLLCLLQKSLVDPLTGLPRLSVHTYQHLQIPISFLSLFHSVSWEI